MGDRRHPNAPPKDHHHTITLTPPISQREQSLHLDSSSCIQTGCPLGQSRPSQLIPSVSTAQRLSGCETNTLSRARSAFLQQRRSLRRSSTPYTQPILHAKRASHCNAHPIGSSQSTLNHSVVDPALSCARRSALFPVQATANLCK